MPGKRNKTLQNDDWKRWRSGWPYKSLEDPRYIRERNRTLKDNGNGWWYLQGIIPASEIGS